MTDSSPDPLLTRCWRCFGSREGAGPCGLCGAPAEGPDRRGSDAATAAAPAPARETEPAADIRETVLEQGPDLDAADRLWSDDERPAQDRRRALVAVAGGLLVAVLAVLAVVALWPGGGKSPAPETTFSAPPRGPEPDPAATSAIISFGRGVRSRASGLATTTCEELPRTRELRCTYRAGRTAADATFRAVRDGPEGERLLEARLVGATDVSRIATPDGEAVTFRLAIGGPGAQQLPWVAWYSTSRGLYAEVSTTDADPADLRRFYADQSA